jgi:WD40 repeat protein
LVATGSWDGTARLWNAATGQLVAVLKGHRSGVHRVQFSTDGRTLLTVGDDAAIGFWNVATGREMLRLDGIFQAALVAQNVEDLPRLSSDDRALLFGPFVEPSESGAPEPRWRYVVTSIPTLAEIDAAEKTTQGKAP